VPRRAAAKTPKSRDETKKETREALIRAGLAAFQEDGLDASLDDICDRAGFTRGAFYVHFADREALLVAVMEHVGEAFLSSVFAGMGGGDAVSLRTVAERFVDSVKAGTYPLMPPRGKKPMVSMQQLLAACAHSKQVRERYRGLVEVSIGAVQALAINDQQTDTVRSDVAPAVIGQLMLAIIIGAQTMGELGVVVDPEALTRAMLKMITPRIRLCGAASRS
jgi:TetR/AcrR family transcriptional regulator, transcriptional repressor for nem operon